MRWVLQWGGALACDLGKSPKSSESPSCLHGGVSAVLCLMVGGVGEAMLGAEVLCRL